MYTETEYEVTVDVEVETTSAVSFETVDISPETPDEVEEDSGETTDAEPPQEVEEDEDVPDKLSDEEAEKLEEDLDTEGAERSEGEELEEDVTTEEIAEEKIVVEEDDGTDWDNSSLTAEQAEQLKEMDENDELEIPEVDENWEEPELKDSHLPTEKSGEFEGERGNSAFHPNDEAALERMKEYGVDSIDYRNGDVDFDPVSKHQYNGREVDSNVEIGHMTGDRGNPSWDFGRRPNGSSHDPNYDIGNFAQADNALAEKTGMSLEEIEDMKKSLNLTWHECPDGKTMQLVPTEIHDACSHSGGVAVRKFLQKMGDITANF